MSLQVWMPLNGDLRNQGLSDVDISGTPNFNENGKIGSCLKTSNQIFLRPANGFTNNNSLSFCAWIKSDIVDSSSTVWWHIFSVFYTDGTKQDVYTADSGNGRYKWEYNPELNIYCDTQVWHHITYTLNNNVLTGYIDGLKVGSSTGNLPPRIIDYFMIGKAMHVSVNDVRIYDHCLSEKEVKEISKGLCLHYKLDNIYSEVATNMFYQTDTYSSIVNNPVWDKELNGNIRYIVSGWGSGYNSGVNSSEIGYHAHWIPEDDKMVMLFPNYNSSVGLKNRWLGISCNNIDTSNIPAGTKYTVSFDMKSEMVGGGVTGGLYYKLTSDKKDAFNDGNSPIGTATVANTWERYSYTFTRSSEYDGTSTTSNFYFYHNYKQECSVWVRNVQLQIGDKATGYIPGKTTYVDNVEWDCSGYGYDGEKHNITLANDSPRYNKSYKFSGNSYIKINNIPLTGSPVDYSFSFWLNTNTDSGNQCIYNGRTSTGAPIAIFIINNRMRFDDGKVNTITTHTVELNKWTHYCFTRDSSNINFYINGELHKTFASTEFSTGATMATIGISSSSPTVSSSNGLYGYLSDYRIYATTLSPSDVKELYETSGSIDKDGNIYAYEFKEG